MSRSELAYGLCPGSNSMRFECKESCGGKCCTLQWKEDSTFVFLTGQDRINLATALGQDAREFANLGEFSSTRFSRVPTTQWYLHSPGGHCRFFDNGRCAVYSARPTQCRTFPNWPEHVRNGRFIKDEVGKTCPGVGKDTKINMTQLDDQRNADRELMARTLL